MKSRFSNTEIGILSRYRACLMGCAGVFIMMCHNTLRFESEILQSWNVRYVMDFFQIGVDIFLFLSGMGCYFSYIKSESNLCFWKKRAIRILPAYIVFLLFRMCEAFLRQGSPLDALITNSPVSFLVLNKGTYWFISAIALCYAVYPKIHRMVESRKMLFLCSYLILAVSIVIQIFYPASFFNRLFLVRLPEFLLGVLFAKWLKNNPQDGINTWILRISGGVFLSVFIVLAEVISSGIALYLKRMLFCLFIPFVCLLLANCFVNRDKFAVLASKLGEIMLEMYLFHTVILAYFQRAFFMVFHPSQMVFLFSLIVNVGAIVIAVIASFILHSVLSRMVTLMNLQTSGQHA